MIVALWVTLALPASAQACTELLTRELRALDDLREADPERAVAAAQAALKDRSRVLTPLERAQFNIIVAFARGSEGRGADARAALDAARVDARRVAPGAGLRLVERRIASGEFGASETPEQYAAGLARLNEVLRDADPGSDDWACLMIARGDFETELDRPDLAVADELAGYNAAKSHGWRRTEALAAFTLATTYRRAGLWSDAERMVSDTIAYAEDAKFARLLAISYMTAGQIYGDERSWSRAIDALAKTRALAAAMGDTLTEAFATLPWCNALIESDRLAEAKATCGSRFATFRTLGRSDLATDSMIYSARLARIEHRFSDALPLLDDILNRHLDEVPERQKSQIFRERADTLAALGRDHAAAVDYRRSLDESTRVAFSGRQRTVAVVAGLTQARALEEANRGLEKQVQVQHDQLVTQARIRRLSILIAVLAMIGSALLGVLLFAASRHRRVLIRHAAVLDSLTQGLSDTVMLVDREHRMQFANRTLGVDAGNSAADHLAQFVPAEAAEAFTAAASTVISRNEALTFDVQWTGSDGKLRVSEQSAAPVFANGELFGVAMRSSDITERKALEEQLRLQAQVLDFMSEGVVVLEPDGAVRLMNAALCELLKIPPGSFIGHRLADRALSAGDREVLNCIARSGDPPDAEITLRRDDGSDVLLALACAPAGDASTRGVICVCRDISLERQVAQEIERAHASEARNVGNSLHEGLAQDLAGIAMYLSGLIRSLGTNKVASDFAAVTQYLNDAIRTARLLAQQISPTTPGRGSLDAALAELATETTTRVNVPVRYLAAGREMRCDPGVADEIYRLTAEAIATAAGREGMVGIEISTTESADAWSLEVRFDYVAGAEHLADTWRLVVDLATYRSRLIGGTCTYGFPTPDSMALVILIPTTVTEFAEA